MSKEVPNSFKNADTSVATNENTLKPSILIGPAAGHSRAPDAEDMKENLEANESRVLTTVAVAASAKTPRVAGSEGSTSGE